MTRIQLMVPVLAALLVTAQAAPTVTLRALERMTPAQLRGLSTAQTEALWLEADRALETFSNTLAGPQPGPQWPKAGVAMYQSLVLTDESYERDAYKKSTGPDWTSDGCSFPVAAAYKKVFDMQACRHHDFAYRNLPQYRQARSEDMRQLVDLRLLLDMRFQCMTDSALNVHQHACDIAAVAAYVQARKTGQAAFNATTARYP